PQRYSDLAITTVLVIKRVFRLTLRAAQGFIDSIFSLMGTVAKLAMRQPFVLFKGLTFQKLCLPGAFRPGDHHN
ncbi:transposase, partial [Klebsiella pneumoniae]|uniref:transposase n=1 Tax=Klebsiella pneumoniae TaxID=573 RepID=UPI00217EA9B3